jgi:diguanylate cyclase (GGDEF)-like protein
MRVLLTRELSMRAGGRKKVESLPAPLLVVAGIGATGTLSLGVIAGLPLLGLLGTVPVLVLLYFYTVPKDWAYTAGASRYPAPRVEHRDEENPTANVADHFVAKEFAAAKQGRDVTLVMFGFDRFEDFAEREGSAAAGEALREFGRLLGKLTRKMNLTARYGWRADSFLSVLSHADAKAAEMFVQRVREATAKSDVAMPAIAAGIAVFQPHLASPEEFVACAVRALAEARSAANSRQGEIRGGETTR